MLLLPVPYLVFCCFFLGISSFLCLPPMKQSSKRGCRGSASCLFLMLCPLLWMLHLQHHAESERPSYRRSLSFLVPVFFELYGSIQFLFISILSRDYIFFTFFLAIMFSDREKIILFFLNYNLCAEKSKSSNV